MNTPDIYDKFEICLNALETGADISAVLRLFPEDSAELAPLLETAQFARSRSYSEPEEAAILRSRTRIIVEANRLRDRKSAGLLGLRLPRLALAVVFVLAILVLGAGGLLVTSAQSLPGDQTYPIKQVIEKLRLQIAPGLSSRPYTESQFQQLRVNEVQQLLDLQRSESIVFTGAVEEITDEFWIIADVLVQVSPQTTLLGQVGKGAFVQVSGTTSSNGWVDAREIWLRTREISGVVEEIASEYIIVSGQRLNLDASSQVDPRLTGGDEVIALVEAFQDGQLWVNAVLRQPAQIP